MDRENAPVLAAGPRLNPKKLLLSKWTAVKPVKKEKHWLVVRLIEPEIPENPLEFVEIEAIHSRRTLLLPWQELRDTSRWLQGWR